MATTPQDQLLLDTLIPVEISSPDVTTVYTDSKSNESEAQKILSANNITSNTVVNVTIDEKTTSVVGNPDEYNTTIIAGETFQAQVFTKKIILVDAKPALASGFGRNLSAFNFRDAPIPGGPDISPYARSGQNIINTSIDITNNSLVHSCDFVNDVKKNIGVKKFLKAVAKWIREGIRKIMQFLGFTDVSGSFSAIINELKRIAAEIRAFKEKYIDPIIEFQKYVLAVLVRIRAIIQWILSLPAKILALLKECITKLLKALVSMFIDAFGSASGEIQAGSDIGKEYKELAAAVKDTVKTVGELVKGATTVAALTTAIGVSATVGLISPVSESELAAADKTIIAYAGSIPPALAVPADPDFLKKSTP